MWRPEHRGRDDRGALRCPGDLTDAEWALMVPLIRFAAQPRRRNVAAPNGPSMRAADVVARLVASLGLPGRLRDVGVREEQLDLIARESMQDRWVHTNPRRIKGPATVRGVVGRGVLKGGRLGLGGGGSGRGLRLGGKGTGTGTGGSGVGIAKTGTLHRPDSAEIEMAGFERVLDGNYLA